jgi:DNA replication protein DnaC
VESKTGDSKNKKLYYNLLKEITSCDILIVDELLKEGGGGHHVQSFLEEMLKNRETDLKPTILISNGDLDALTQKYDVHFISALMKRYRAFYFDTSKDLRRQERRDWNL